MLKKVSVSWDINIWQLVTLLVFVVGVYWDNKLQHKEYSLTIGHHENRITQLEVSQRVDHDKIIKLESGGSKLGMLKQ